MSSLSKKRHISPKMAPLPGVLVLSFKRCGAARCKCARGELHGPYWRHQWREDGRTRRRYVKLAEVELLRAQLTAWQEQHPPLAPLRSELALLRRLVRALKEE